MKFNQLFQVMVICILILPASAIASLSIYPLNSQNSVFSNNIVNSGFSNSFENQFISPQNVDNSVLIPNFNPVYRGGIPDLPISMLASQSSIQDIVSNENSLLPTNGIAIGFSNSLLTQFVPRENVNIGIPSNLNPTFPMTGFNSLPIGSSIIESQNLFWNGYSTSNTGQFSNPTVKISREQAIEIAKKQYGDITLSGSPSASLIIGGNLRQVWKVTMEGYLPGDRIALINDKTGEIVGYSTIVHRGGTAYIDATTGEVLSVDYIL